MRMKKLPKFQELRKFMIAKIQPDLFRCRLVGRFAGLTGDSTNRFFFALLFLFRDTSKFKVFDLAIVVASGVYISLREGRRNIASPPKAR